MLDLFKLDEIISLLGQTVTLQLKNGSFVTGRLYTVDPTSHNVVLENNDTIQIVMGHFVSSFSAASTDTNTNTSTRADADAIPTAYSQDWIDSRRNDLIELFEKNRIPIEFKQGEPVIKVLGCARVESPYTAMNVVSDNALIRKRVRDMILNR